MAVYRVNYKADGKQYTILIEARSTDVCIEHLEKIFNEMQFEKAKILNIVEIED